jgi:hypothetical protein
MNTTDNTTDNTTENEQEKQVDEILEKHGISYMVTLLQKSAKDENNWEHDVWKYTIGGKIVFSDFFKTGTGLRKMNKRGDMIPQFPKAGSVLYCILSDSEALDQSFSDWSACFGYDEDSRKAEKIYFECCETGKNVRACFTCEQLEEIKEALQDY